MMTINYLQHLYLFVLYFLIQRCDYAVANHFNVYWNVDNRNCERLGIHFDLSHFGIIQNWNNSFQNKDDKVWISYAPGKFPYFDKGNAVNGGIPQKGDITAHMVNFQTQLKKATSSEFNGVGILDFERYFPHHDSAPPIYQSASFEWAKAQHPTWSNADIQKLSRETFDNTSMLFFKSLLEEGKLHRPNSSWGYYHFPYCNNYTPNSNSAATCSAKTRNANNAMIWLYKSSDVFFPSIYISNKNSWALTRNTFYQVKGRIDEALRIRNDYLADEPYKRILPYFWNRYKEEPHEYISAEKVLASLGAAKTEGADGAVIWDYGVSSIEDCNKLKKYIFEVVGPIAAYLSGTY